MVATPAPEILAINGEQAIAASLLQGRGFQITGTRAPGSEVRVTIGATTRVVVAGAEAGWFVNFAGNETVQLLMDGSPTEVVVSAVAVLPGRPESAVVTRSFRLIWTAPSAPTIEAVTGDDYIQVSDRNAGFALTGLAAPGSTISLRWVWFGGENSRVAGEARAGADSRWTLSIAAGTTSWMNELAEIRVDAVASNPGGSSAVTSRSAKVEEAVVQDRTRVVDDTRPVVGDQLPLAGRGTASRPGF